MLRELFSHIASASASATVKGSNSTTYSYSTGIPKISAGSSQLNIILQITFGIIGAIAVLIIIIAGFRYVLSEGKSDNAARARETIIYAIVGLIVSISAEVIVAFVLNKVG